MVTPAKEKDLEVQEELKVKSPEKEMGFPSVSAGTIRRVAEEAAESYAPDEVEQHAQAIGEAWKNVLKVKTKEFRMRSRDDRARAALEIAEPISPVGYTWWNLLLAGPYQVISTGGPYLPSKEIRAGEPAFMIAIMWRNPNPLPMDPNSAATLMNPYHYSLSLQTINLTSVTNGPDFGPLTGEFGTGFLNVFTIPLSFPAPPQGIPHLYEANMVVDITNPGMPFAGYNTWIFDPDTEPSFGLPGGFWHYVTNLGWVYIPGVPGSPSGLQHDTPARFLVYRA